MLQLPIDPHQLMPNDIMQIATQPPPRFTTLGDQPQPGLL
jgi:hypothetical protein